MISSSPPRRKTLNYPTGYPLRYVLFEQVVMCLRDGRIASANVYLDMFVG
jgi:ketosteroid isomerase-like protein